MMQEQIVGTKKFLQFVIFSLLRKSHFSVLASIIIIAANNTQ